MQLTDRDVNKLCYEIVRQAIRDWRYLCRGGETDKWCNFDGLELFFQRGCDGYVNPDVADRIYELLQRERAVYDAVSVLA